MKNCVIDVALIGATYVCTSTLLATQPFKTIPKNTTLPYYAMAAMYTNGKSNNVVKLVSSMIISDQAYELLKQSNMYKDNTSLLNLYFYGFLSVVSTSVYFNDNNKLHPGYRTTLASVMTPLMHEPQQKYKYAQAIFKVSYKYIAFKFAMRCVKYMYARISTKHKTHDELYEQIFNTSLTVQFLRNYFYLFFTAMLMYIIQKHKLTPLLNMFCGFVLVGFETSSQQKNIIKFTGGQFIYTMLQNVNDKL